MIEQRCVFAVHIVLCSTVKLFANNFHHNFIITQLTKDAQRMFSQYYIKLWKHYFESFLHMKMSRFVWCNNNVYFGFVNIRETLQNDYLKMYAFFIRCFFLVLEYSILSFWNHENVIFLHIENTFLCIKNISFFCKHLRKKLPFVKM